MPHLVYPPGSVVVEDVSSFKQFYSQKITILFRTPLFVFDIKITAFYDEIGLFSVVV